MLVPHNDFVAIGRTDDGNVEVAILRAWKAVEQAFTEIPFLRFAECRTRLYESGQFIAFKITLSVIAGG